MKTIYLSVILLASSLCSFAQFSFGVKGGAQLNNIHFKGLEKNTFDTGPTIGIHLGAFLQIDINNKLAFIPELQYIKRGFQDDTGMESTRLNANYLEVPLLISFAPVKMLRLEAGPTLGYSVTTVTVRDGKRTTNNDLFDKRFELGLSAGIRVVPTDKIAVMLQYHYGLTPFDEISMRDINNVTTSGTIHNTGVQLSIAYKLFSK